MSSIDNSESASGANTAAGVMPREVAVRVTDVRKAFPGTQALAGCSLTLNCGECHGLVGENGAGKSTLMKILAGAQAADSGTIQVFGREVAFATPREARAAGVSAIYQELELIPDLSVAENVFLGREPRLPLGRVGFAAMRDGACRLLATLSRDVDPGARVGSLNLAEKQLVEIARALAADARLFLMDEPTAALGDHDRDGLFSVIRKLTAAGAAVVFISHRLEEVLAICDRVTVMRDGRVVLSDRAEAFDKDRLIVAMAGEQQHVSTGQQAREAGRTAGSGAALDVEGLCTATGLRGISMHLRAGEIVVVTGLAGSGRTRLLRALFGADAITAGAIRLLGNAFQPSSPSHAARNGIGFLGEERREDGLIPELSVRTNITLASLPRFRGRFGLIGRVRETAAAAEQSAAVNVKSASLETPIRLLSGGNQQKALLARWLLAGARVLLLDEPTRGVDINGKHDIYRLLRRQADAGLAILATTSELPEAMLLADRIVVMRDGSVAGELSREQATPEAMLRLAMSAGQE